jgi:hypothetical protein
MTKKKYNTKTQPGKSKTAGSKTGRRNFLKISAAFTGVALMENMLRPAMTLSADDSRKDVTGLQFLFVQNAKDVSIKKGELILIGVSPTTIFFSDRPNRIAGHMHTKEFVDEWQKGMGTESFLTDPPNAALSVFGEDEVVDVAMTLKNPRLSGGALVYDIDILEQDRPIPHGPVSLFIDPIGEPLSPGSVAGVRRRTRRRTRRRAAVLY